MDRHQQTLGQRFAAAQRFQPRVTGPTRVHQHPPRRRRRLQHRRAALNFPIVARQRHIITWIAEIPLQKCSVRLYLGQPLQLGLGERGPLEEKRRQAALLQYRDAVLGPLGAELAKRAGEALALKLAGAGGDGAQTAALLSFESMDTEPAEDTVVYFVGIDDAAEADRTFDMLMGDAVDPRKKFIQTHAKSVRNLDI